MLSPYDYEKFVFPYVKHIADNLTGAPLIYFAKDSYSFADTIGQLNCAGMGVDWKTRLVDADAKLGKGKFVLQGILTRFFSSAQKKLSKSRRRKSLRKAEHLKVTFLTSDTASCPPPR